MTEVTAPEIVWADPTPDRRADGHVAAFAAALKSNPGQWAIYPGSAHGGACNYLKNRYGLEAVVRTVDNKKTVYARWVA